MLVALKSILGRPVEATDGHIGKAFDFFFDDEYWGIRYLIVDTGTWLPSKKRLLSVANLQQVEPDGLLHIGHTKHEIEHSPEIDLAQPLTDHEEMLIHRHYDIWPHWARYFTEAGPHKMTSLRDRASDDLGDQVPRYALNSALRLDKFRMNFGNDVAEKIVDLLIDPGNWSVQQFIVKHGAGPMSRELSVPRDRVVDYDRETHYVYTRMTPAEAQSREEALAHQ